MRPWLGVVVALVVGLALGTALRRDPVAGDDQTLATAELVALSEGVEPAVATLVGSGDERLVLLEIDAAVPVDGFHEVWLLDDDAARQVSLGPLRTDGRHVVPPGVDTDTFTTVDVSVEPPDGDPTPSGLSLLRAPLTPPA